jgi:hypothetical protein
LFAYLRSSFVLLSCRFQDGSQQYTHAFCKAIPDAHVKVTAFMCFGRFNYTPNALSDICCPIPWISPNLVDFVRASLTIDAAWGAGSLSAWSKASTRMIHSHKSIFSWMGEQISNILWTDTHRCAAYVIFLIRLAVHHRNVKSKELDNTQIWVPENVVCLGATPTFLPLKSAYQWKGVHRQDLRAYFKNESLEYLVLFFPCSTLIFLMLHPFDIYIHEYICIYIVSTEKNLG